MMIVVIDKKENDLVALVVDQKTLITTAVDAIDLVMAIVYQYQCTKIVFKQEQFNADFFDLKTKLAGEILQKLTNYHISIAIVGDFSGYASKSLHDFIFESNKGSRALFVATQDEALTRLHQSV